MKTIVKEHASTNSVNYYFFDKVLTATGQCLLLFILFIVLTIFFYFNSFYLITFTGPGTLFLGTAVVVSYIQEIKKREEKNAFQQWILKLSEKLS